MCGGWTVLSGLILCPPGLCLLQGEVGGEEEPAPEAAVRTPVFCFSVLGKDEGPLFLKAEARLPFSFKGAASVGCVLGFTMGSE